MKDSQPPAQDKGQAGKSDLQASHRVFPSERLTHCNRPGLAGT